MGKCVKQKFERMIILNLTPYLDDIESRINVIQEERLEQEWLNFADGKHNEMVFDPKRIPSEPTIEYPPMIINHAFTREDWMVYQQLKSVSDAMAGTQGILLSIRPNYGTGIIPSMFDAPMFFLDDNMNTLPCTHFLADGQAAIERILEKKEMNFSKGLAKSVFTFGEIYKEAIKDYPLISRYVHVYNPDLQGPFPLIDALWGSEIYTALYDEEDLLHEGLTFMTDVYLEFINRWQALFPRFDKDHSIEWGLLHKGRVIIRNDACMNISGNMYREFVMPYDQRILSTVGGGIHFCGRGDHYVDILCGMENIGCLNISQPYLNDMEIVYKASVDQGIPIIGVPDDEVKRALKIGRDLHGLVHAGASLAAWEKGSNVNSEDA